MIKVGTVDMADFWPVVLVLALGTFLIRYSFILIMDKLTIPDSVHRMLRYIPASALTALVAPAVLLDGSSGGFAGWDKLAAASVAVLVAWKTRNIFFTIALGMATLWTFHALM